MKSLIQLHRRVLAELGEECSAETARDIQYITRRTEAEGESFLTIILPQFAQALERGISDGLWPRQSCTSFKYSSGLPAFMRGFLLGIFSSDGVLLECPDPAKVRAVRQFCYLTYKIERECTPKRKHDAIRSYVSTDEELCGLPGRISSENREIFQRVARRVFGTLFQEIDRKIASWELIPKHGPGSTADSLRPIEKWDFGYWPSRLEGVFPHWRYASNLPRYRAELGLIPRHEELPAKVALVPKTQKTPRIIAMEPSTVQYAQQALKVEIYAGVANSELNHLIGFSDQTRNQRLALAGSLDGSLATLDLSEASDRVHPCHVRWLVGGFPHLEDFVFATRSERSMLPSGEVIPLHKFASMGSALTFPLETMIFLIVALIGCGYDGKTPFRISRWRDSVSIYGDDIIVPADRAASVKSLLEAYGFKVNSRKSFWNGKFRESCGKEYFMGEDVTVVRLRHELPTDRRDAAAVAAFVDFRNRLFWAGLWKTTSACDEEIRKLIKLTPARNHNHGLMQATTLPYSGPVSYDTDLQYETVKHHVLKPRSRKYRVDGEAGVLKWFSETLHRSMVSPDRYDSQERASAFSIHTVRTSRALLD